MYTFKTYVLYGIKNCFLSKYSLQLLLNNWGIQIIKRYSKFCIMESFVHFRLLNMFLIYQNLLLSCLNVCTYIKYALTYQDSSCGKKGLEQN